MGTVSLDKGAVLGEAEATYGVKPTMADALYMSDFPSLTHNDVFDNVAFLALSPTTAPGDREHQSLSISFANWAGILVDQVAAISASHAVLVAGGAGVSATNGAAGVGNFVEYQPVSSGYGSSSFTVLFHDSANGELSAYDHLGTRGNWTLNIDGGNDRVLFDFEGQALHSFPQPFAAAAGLEPSTQGYDIETFKNKCVTLEVAPFGTTTWTELPVESFSFSPNLEIVVDEDDITACDAGISEIQVEPSDAGAGGSLVIKFRDTDIDLTDVANYIYDAHENDIDFAMRITVEDGATATQRMRLTMPKVRWQDIQIADGNTTRVWNVEYIAQDDAGDDHYTLRFERLA